MEKIYNDHNQVSKLLIATGGSLTGNILAVALKHS